MARDLGYWSGTFTGILSGLAMCSLSAYATRPTRLGPKRSCIKDPKRSRILELACLRQGVLGQSKSLGDDSDLVVADGYLESDRELIALEQYMRDSGKREKMT